MHYDLTHQQREWDGTGRCPHCDSWNVETLDDGPEDEYYFYAMECLDCGCHFKDWFKMEPMEREWATPEEIEQQRNEFSNSMLAYSAAVAQVQAEIEQGILPQNDFNITAQAIRHNADLAVNMSVDENVSACKLLEKKANWNAITQSLYDDDYV